MKPLPEITSESQLQDLLSDPSPEDIEMAGRLNGDLVVLGAGGKMGPTLVRRIARALIRAGSSHRVWAVSRFSNRLAQEQLEAEGATTLALDLLQPESWSRLPESDSVIFMAGSKFGTEQRQDLTWATNAYLPGRVLEQYPGSPIVVLSTGNVYPLAPVDGAGCSEDQAPAPIGEYAQSCLGRERIVEYFSRRTATPVCLLRLNYAVETRYGVLLDIARKVWNGEAVPLQMGYVNVIWQGDANSACFRSLALCRTPPRILNLTGPDVLSVRELALQFGRLMGRSPKFSGKEADSALLSDSRRSHELLGRPPMSLPAMLTLVANWVRNDGPTLDKPTRFEVRDGKF